MNDENARFFIALAVLALFSLTILMFVFRSCSKSQTDPVVESKPSEVRQPVATTLPDIKPPDRSGHSTPSYARYSRSALPAASPAHLKALENARAKAAERSRKIQEKSKARLEKFLNDESVSTYTRELYALRTDRDMQLGQRCLRRKQFSSARESFAAAAMDKERKPSIRYQALEKLMYIAKQEKDYDSYFAFAKEMGKILSEHDLPLFKKTKSDAFLKDIKEKEIYFKARNDVSMQESIARFLVQDVGKEDAFNFERAMKEVKKKIERVEREVL